VEEGDDGGRGRKAERNRVTGKEERIGATKGKAERKEVGGRGKDCEGGVRNEDGGWEKNQGRRRERGKGGRKRRGGEGREEGRGRGSGSTGGRGMGRQLVTEGARERKGGGL